MKVLFAVAVLAVAVPATLAAPSGIWGGLGHGVVLAAGPTTVSRTSLVQTHPSPAVVVAAPAVHAVPSIVSAPIAVASPGVVAVNGLGLGHGGVVGLGHGGVVGLGGLGLAGLGLGHGW